MKLKQKSADGSNQKVLEHTQFSPYSCWSGNTLNVLKMLVKTPTFVTQNHKFLKNLHVYCLKPSGWWLTYPSEKYEFVNGKDDIPYMKWTTKAMFETTN
jgi:hypothetical protein